MTYDPQRCLYTFFIKEKGFAKGLHDCLPRGLAKCLDMLINIWGAKIKGGQNYHVVYTQLHTLAWGYGRP